MEHPMLISAPEMYLAFYSVRSIVKVTKCTSGLCNDFGGLTDMRQVRVSIYQVNLVEI